MLKQIIKVKNDQRGIASFIIAIFFMLILSLIVLSMSRDANREQRQALDRQLNTQAFYAAESGVNDTIDYVRNNPNPAQVPAEWEQCGPPPGFDANKRTLDTVGPVGYTCAMYDTAFETLKFDEVAGLRSQIVVIEPAKGSSVDRLRISWKKNDVPPEQANYTGCGNFLKGANATSIPPTGQYPPAGQCSAGFLRTELVDTRDKVPNDNVGPYSRQNLDQNTFAAFFVPENNGGGTVNLSAGQGNNKGVVRQAQCSNGNNGTSNGMCNMTINGLNLKPGERMYLRMTPIYNAPFNIEVNGETLPDNNNTRKPSLFTRAQLLVDVTGKANDVLKRIQVRVPLDSSSEGTADFRFPEFAIHSDSVCKQLQILPPGIPGFNSRTDC